MAGKAIEKSAKRWVAAIIFALITVFMVGFYFSASHSHEDFLTLTDAPEGTKIEAVFETREDVRVLSQKDRTFNMPEDSEARIFGLYRIRASMRMPWGDYRDIVLDVNKGKSLFKVLADGFIEDDKITILVDGKTLYQNLPMDWSGRLELQAMLSSKKQIHACIKIDGRMGAVGFCHVLPKGTA